MILQELLAISEATKESTPMYKVSWKGYPGNPKPETHDISYFDDEMGFTKDDIEEIKKPCRR